jgi:TM2 domain-containing membrane protein YozV
MGNLYRSQNGTYVVPGILSALIPGLGQLLKKSTTKALMFFAIWLFWGIAVWILGWIPILGGLVGTLAGVFLWFVNVLDALLAGEGQ